MKIELPEKINSDNNYNGTPSEANLIEADTSQILAEGVDNDPDKELKKNLMFAQKDITSFQLLCH